MALNRINGQEELYVGGYVCSPCDAKGSEKLTRAESSVSDEHPSSANTKSHTSSRLSSIPSARLKTSATCTREYII